MPLTPGTRLGPYEILAPLGAGGMGEVYRARDTRLGRDIALKMLPEDVASSPDLLARLEREARAVATLNHPNVVVLHSIEEHGRTRFLTMELVEGESLDRLITSGGLPIARVLELGIAISDAVAAAHTKGVVHRDLKPANVVVTREGRPKVLDFGLARLAPADSTITAMTTLTTEGVVMGTTPYMAPELLEGGQADERSDVWALGCVLYEMATGKQAFEGESQASLISSILLGEPTRLSQVAPLTPHSLDRLVLACLAKDRDERVQSAHDVKLQLQWIAEDRAHAKSLTSSRTSWRTWAALAGAAVALVGLSIVATLALHRPSGDRDSVRFLMSLPPGQVSGAAPRMSPDGSTMAFVATDSSGAWRVWLRSMASLEAHPIAGTEGVVGPPFWSPDNKSLAFLVSGKLQKVPVAGGGVVTLAEVGDYRSDGSWGSSGMILLDALRGDSMVVVSAAGGAIRPASRLDRIHGDVAHMSPRFLPDGQHFVFVSGRLLNGQTKQVILLGRLGSLETRELGTCSSDIDVAPPNHVLYTNGTSLVTQTLDISRGALTGDPIPLAEGIPLQSSFVFSAGGPSLAVVNTSGTMSELVWVDRAGHLLSRVGEPNRYREIALSPDGRRLALSIEDPINGFDDVWVRDLERGISTRLTFDRTQETGPIWSADGARIFYSSDRQGGYYIIYSLSASGTGSEDTLSFGNAGQEGPMSVSTDGKWLVSGMTKGTTWDWDVMIRDVEGKDPPRRFCGSPSIEFAPMLSPDGRWLAYASDETGREEVYVRSFPDGLRKWRVSRDGGSVALWSKNGRELIYQNPTKDLIAVPVTPGADFQPGQPLMLFHADMTQQGWTVRRWAVTDDGQRFLINQSVKSPLRGFTVTKNWLSAVEHGP